MFLKEKCHGKGIASYLRYSSLCPLEKINVHSLLKLLKLVVKTPDVDLRIAAKKCRQKQLCVVILQGSPASCLGGNT